MNVSGYLPYSPLILGWKIYESFFNAYMICLDAFSNFSSNPRSLNELELNLRHKMNIMLHEKYREQEFINALSDTVAIYSDIAKNTGVVEIYQKFSNMLSLWNNIVIEPVRDNFWRTPSHKVCNIEKFSLFRYDTISEEDTLSQRIGEINTKTSKKMTKKQPLLVVYAFINRHYILDLLPDISVIRKLLESGFDIFATDWGTPGPYDKDLNINHYVNTYMDKSVDYIRNLTGSEKVSLLGYCWGGNLVLLYAASHPEKVKNIVTLATPGDASQDNGLLSTWTKNMKVDKLLDAFGNAPSFIINAAFALRSPVEYMIKYPRFFEQPHDLETTLEFFATETWLHDSRPIIGDIYREFVKNYYQENLFIKNQMRLDGKTVNMSKITAPFLNVIAIKDDLVSASSSKALNNVIGSRDKSIIELNSGHVGLIIGSTGHKEIWPKVGEWLKIRS